MITEELLVFIRKERKKKTKDIDIRGMLVAHGWTKEQIDEGFNRVDGVIVQSDGSPLGSLPMVTVFLRETYVLFTKNILFFIKLFLSILIAAILLFVAAGALGALGVWIILLDRGIGFAVLGGVLLTAAIALFFVGVVYLSAFSTGGFVLRLLDEVETVADVRQKVRPYVWTFFLTNVLLSLVLLFGYLLLIVPGIILAVRLLFVKYIIFTEHETGRAAIAKSLFYTKGFFWKIAERLAPIAIVTWILNAALRTFLESENLWFFAIPFWALTMLAGAFFSISLFVLYQHVRTAKGDLVPDEEMFTKYKRRILWAVVGGFILPILFMAVLVTFMVNRPEVFRTDIISRIEAIFSKDTTQQLPFDPQPQIFDASVSDEEGASVDANSSTQ